MLNKSALSVIKAAGYGHIDNERFLRSKFAVLPKSFRAVVNERYIQTFKNQSFRDANLMLLDVTRAAAGRRGLMASSDAELCAHAEKCAKQAGIIASRFMVAGIALQELEKYALSEGVTPPPDTVTETGRRARLLCAKWWRRALRKNVAREVEKYAISLGLVNKRRGIYASDETVSRRVSQKARNAKTLQRVIAENEAGQEFTLAELSALNVSNPKLRRKELMTRLAGFDALAVELGHAADFYTLTAPSKYHAFGTDGKPNKKYQGFTPKQGQEFLSKTWAQVRAYLASRGVKVYGFRVAEAHHDGTPHWHMVLFYEKRFVKFVRLVIRDYFLGIRRPFLKHDGRGGFKVAKNTGVCWLSHSGGEFGASRVRTTVQAIDRAKGSAAGYLAKYISKNIDGHAMQASEDYEGGEVIDNVNRVDAWASCWGIRQFQQIGGAPVGVWRECRRLDVENVGGSVQDLVAACGGADWAKYTKLQGGAFVSRKDLAARVWREKLTGGALVSVNYESGLVTQGASARRSLYGDLIEVVRGVCAYGVNIKTRVHEWTLKTGFVAPMVDMARVLKSELASAWSSVNNCNNNLQNDGVKAGWVKPKFRFVREKMPRIFGEWWKTGILDGESLINFDVRGFKHGY